MVPLAHYVLLAWITHQQERIDQALGTSLNPMCRWRFQIAAPF